jgi:hypothetical protein
MRKLLILTYTLWKKDEEYNSEYEWKESKKAEPESSALDRLQIEESTEAFFPQI